MSRTGHRRPASVRLRQGVALGVASVLALVMLVLGVWQMSVYRNQGRDALIARSQQPPVPLSQRLDSGTPIGALYGLQVRLRGHYLDLPPVVVGDAPPYRVVSAFQDDSRIVPVVRGTVPAPGADVPAPPSGEVSVAGVLMPSETGPGARAASDEPTGALSGVRIERLAQDWPVGVTAGFVTLNPADAARDGLRPATVTFPQDTSGHAQNLGYAIQWWVFAIFAMIMGVVVARSLGRRPSPATAPERHAGTE